MPRIDFDQLPPESRLWIFAAGRALTDDEQAQVLGAVDQFIEQWAAHDRPLTTARDLRYDRFIFVAVDERAAGASGCSIDALVNQMKRLEAAIGVELINHGPVLYRDGEDIARVERFQFMELVEKGAVSPDTVVFDNTLTTVADVRNGRWELPAGQSWHKALF